MLLSFKKPKIDEDDLLNNEAINAEKIKEIEEELLSKKSKNNISNFI